MKSLYFSADHQRFRDTVRKFVEREIVPEVDDWERERKIPGEMWRKMGELGFLGINLPEKYGGTEADFFYSVVFLEELGRTTALGIAASMCVQQYITSEYLCRFGTDELRERYLVPSISGDMIGALGITEPNTGSDVASLQTRAERKGDHFLINGSKTFITNGAYSDFVLLAVKTGARGGTGGISIVLVDRDMPGFTARKLEKIGWHCSDTAELFFEDVRVPVSNLIGEENRGFYTIMECFQLERLVLAIATVGTMEHCMELTLRYLSEREVFGRSISKFQAIRHTLADLATEIEAARQLTYHAAWLYDQGEEVTRQCTMAKLKTTELAIRVATTCSQYFGGYGYMDEYPISRLFRDVKVGTVGGGTSEIMREIIARMMIDRMHFDSRK